jgi:hypothetical protein
LPPTFQHSRQSGHREGWTRVRAYFAHQTQKRAHVGDHYQLPPVFKTLEEAVEQPEAVDPLSAFNRLIKLAGEERAVWLKTHYRSNPAIIRFASERVYGGSRVLASTSSTRRAPAPTSRGAPSSRRRADRGAEAPAACPRGGPAACGHPFRFPDPSPSANLSALGPEVHLLNVSVRSRSFPSKFPLSAGNRERVSANPRMCQKAVRVSFHELRGSRRKGL